MSWHPALDQHTRDAFYNQPILVDPDEAPMLNKNEVTVKKPELLEALKANREKHIAEYREALQGYRDKVRARLVVLLDEVVTADEDWLPTIAYPRPTSHVDDYDRVIRMLTMSVEDQISIREDQFACYVLDDWHWKGDHRAVSSAYKR